MVKRRDNEEHGERRERTPPIKNDLNGQSNKKLKNERQKSAKDGERGVANSRRNIQKAISHNTQPGNEPVAHKPHENRPSNNKHLKIKVPDNSLHKNNTSDNKSLDNNHSDKKPNGRKLDPAKQIGKGIAEIRNNNVEDLQDYKNKLMNMKINKGLVKNMKDSMLSLHVLLSGFSKQAAQVMQQQRNANRVWDDLEAQLLKMNSDLCDEISHMTNTDESSRGGRTDTPTILPLPHIIDSFSRKSNDVSRQNSLPSLFKNNDTPGEKESEIFTANRTNNIRKVAQRRTKERSTNAADLFPTVTQDRGMPLLRLTASGNDSKSKIPGLIGSKEARQRVAKRLIEMKAFQDKYIAESNKSQTPAHESNIDDISKQESRKEISKKMK